MQTHFSQEGNHPAMWDTMVKTYLTTRKFPRLVVVTYTEVEWLSEGGRTPNQLRVCLEEMTRTEGNFQNTDRELFFWFTMEEA